MNPVDVLRRIYNCMEKQDMTSLTELASLVGMTRTTIRVYLFPFVIKNLLEVKRMGNIKVIVKTNKFNKEEFEKLLKEMENSNWKVLLEK